MFIWSARIRPKRLLCCLLALAVVVSGVRIWVGGESKAVQAPALEAKNVKSNEDRLGFLTRCGWTVAEEPLTVEELMIPKEFDESYAAYLELQSAQGFDLSRFSGCRVKRYVYEILNYPSGETGVQVGILIYKNQVIGGEVLSARLDGFIHGLTDTDA
jgi:hypothetical protein